MKVQQLWIVGILLSIIACDKNDDNDFTTRKDNLIGSWTVSSETLQESDSVSFTFFSVFDLELMADGQAVQEDPFLQTDRTMEWIYQLAPEKVVLFGLSISGTTIRQTTVFDVMENTTDQHIWMASRMGVDFASGDTLRIEETWTLRPK